MTGTPEEKVAQIDGRALVYRELGSGPALVMLHGAGPGASGWSNFSRNAHYFARSHRVIVPNFPGWGGSVPTDLSRGLFAALADSVLGLLDSLEIQCASFIGNSLGGGTSIRIALEAPTRVQDMVLMAPGGLQPAFAPMPTEGLKHLFSYYLPGRPSREALREFLSCMVFDASTITSDLLEDRYLASIAPESIRQAPLVAGSLPPIEALWREDLSRIKCPVLLMWGRDDRTIPLDCALIALQQLHNAELHVVTRCGHWVQWEHPELFNRTVHEFLSRKRGQEP